MPFRELPLLLRIYILAHVPALLLLGAALSAAPAPESAPLLAVLALFTVIFSTWKVELPVFQGRMTLGFAVVCLALLLEGVVAAVLCAALGGLVGTLVSPERSGWRLRLLRPKLYRVFFNAANCALAAALASFLFQAITRSALDSAAGTLLGLVLFTAVYFCLNTAGISLAIALQQRLRPHEVWHQNFLWTAPGYFASASAAVGIQALYAYLNIWSLLFLPPLYLVYYSYRLYMDRIHLYTQKLQQDMEHIQQLNQLSQAIIASLAAAIDAKDRYTSSHIDRVQRYAVALAKAAGLSGPELQAVETGAVVHDIGKLGIPDHILGKPGKLTAEEFRRIQSHVELGVEILAPIPFTLPVLDVVRSHHERWDGRGYPRGLKGEEIPIGGRIITIVDVFDALTSDRPYRRALTHEEALQALREGAGKQFDPRLVELFEQILPGVLEEMRAEEVASGPQTPSLATRPAAAALDQISRAAAEMAAMCDVAQALAEQETPEEIHEIAVARALAFLPADTAVLYLFRPGSEELEIAAVQGRYRDKLRGMTISPGEGVAGWVAAHQQPLINASATLDIARRFGPEENIELSAVTAVPLVHGTTTLGVLSVYTQSYSILSDHHLAVLNILAEHTAAALQNCHRIQESRELAFVDPLTGLTNSRGLFRALDRLLYVPAGAATPPAPFAVVMLDLDRFKEVNDTFGHLRGDDLLRQVAERIHALCRPEDTVCRYAGDEFVLLLPGADARLAERVGERVRQAIDAIPAVEGMVRIGASVGVAAFPEDGVDRRALLQAADQRMYENKYQRRVRRAMEMVGEAMSESGEAAWETESSRLEQVEDGARAAR